MKNYLKILLIISFMFFGCTNLKKSLDTKYQINEIIIYLDFQEKGYTTASAYTHFDNLIHDRIDTVILSSIELNNIELVLSNALQKKHKQTKLGINLIFCKVKYFDNEKEYSKVVIGIGKNSIYFIDLNRMLDFEIVKKDHKQLILDIFSKYKNN